MARSAVAGGAAATGAGAAPSTASSYVELAAILRLLPVRGTFEIVEPEVEDVPAFRPFSFLTTIADRVGEIANGDGTGPVAAGTVEVAPVAPVPEPAPTEPAPVEAAPQAPVKPEGAPASEEEPDAGGGSAPVSM